MASLEKNFWQEIRKKLKHYQWLRLESYATQGVPDLLGTTQDGMFFTVERMINSGKHDVKILSDGWTAVTKDKSLCAQFEHSVGVTDIGYEIFTLSSDDEINQKNFKH